MRPVSLIGVAAQFLADLARFRPRLLAAACLLLTARSLSDGLTYALLVPLLGYIGIGPGTGEAQRLRQLVLELASGLGLAPGLEGLLLLFFAVLLVRALLGYAFTVASASLEQGFVDHVRRRLYTALSRANWLHLAGSRQSRNTHALTMQAEQAGNAAYLFLNATAILLTFCASVGVAWLASPRLTLAVIAGAIALFLLLIAYQKWAFERGLAAWRAMQQLYDLLGTRVDGLKLAKAFSIETVLESKFAAASHSYQNLAVEVRRNEARALMAQELAAGLLLLAFVYASLVILGASSLELILLIAIFSRLLPRANDFQANMRSLAAILPDYQGILSVEAAARAAEEELPEAAARIPLKSAIALDNVSFRYPDQRESWALREITVELPAHSVVGLIGLSAAGKSTLADVVAGLIEPVSGRLLIDNKPIGAAERAGWRAGVTYVAQDSPLLHDTVCSNLLLGAADISNETLWHSLELARAADLVRRLPDGLATVVGDRGVRLSGGERQRLRLASALLRKPELLILDEATSALNPVDEQEIIAALRGLRDHMTIIVIAHRLSSVAWADHLLVLRAGRMLDFGPTGEIMRRSEGPISEMRAHE